MSKVDEVKEILDDFEHAMADAIDGKVLEVQSKNPNQVIVDTTKEHREVIDDYARQIDKLYQPKKISPYALPSQAVDEYFTPPDELISDEEICDWCGEGCTLCFESKKLPTKLTKFNQLLQAQLAHCKPLLIEQGKKEERERERHIFVDITSMIGSFSDSEDWDDLSERGQNWLSRIADKATKALKGADNEHIE